jgi:hypothetical protein
MKNINSFFLFSLLVQLLFISCTNTSTSYFQMVNEIEVNENELIIERQPPAYNVINDSIIATIVNDKNLVLYNSKTGNISKIIDSSALDLRKLHSEIVKQKEKNFNDTNYRYLSWDEIDSFNNAYLPRFIIHQFSYNKNPYLFASLLTSYSKQDTTIFIYSEFTDFIIKVNSNMDVENLSVLDYTPHHLRKFNEPFLWCFQGFIMEDSVLYTNINIEGNTNAYGNKLCAKFIFSEQGFKLKNYMNVPLPDSLRKEKTNILSAGTPTPYIVNNDNYYISNGTNIFNLKTGEQITENLLSNKRKDYIINFGFSSLKDTIYFSYFNSKLDKIVVVIYDLRKSSVISQKLFSKMTKINFYRDKLSCFNYREKDEKYFFTTYNLITN